MSNSPDESKSASDALAVPVDEYNAFIEGIELASIRLAKSSIDASTPFDGSVLSPEVEEMAASYQLVSDGFVVLQELRFTGRPTGSTSDSVSISATFELAFRSEIEISDALFSVFRRFNLPVNVWPFFREFVHTVLARVNWPVFLLPALKIGNRGAKPPRRRRKAST